MPIVVLILFLLGGTAARGQSLPTSVALDYEYEELEDIDSWHLRSIELGRRFPRNTLVGRFSDVERFGQKGQQIEIEAYPRIRESTWAVVSVSTANVGYLAEWGVNGEVFHTLPSSYEFSAGVRRLDFEQTDATIWTGSGGKYEGRYFYALRSFYVDLGGQDSSKAVQLSARRFFASPDDQWTAVVLYGNAPEDPVIAREIGMHRWMALVFGQKRVTDNWIVRGKLGAREQDLGSSGRASIFIGLGILRRF